jgi:pentatricopeptide repeat domain-containing protein 1
VRRQPAHCCHAQPARAAGCAHSGASPARDLAPTTTPAPPLPRSVITYSALISACEKAGQWETALELFGRMTAEGCVPNVITYNSLITACGQVRAPGPRLRPGRAGTCGRGAAAPATGRLALGFGVSAQALNSKALKPGARAGRAEGAALQNRPRPPAPQLTPRARTLAPAPPRQGAQWEHAADIFSRMQRSGCRPDVVTYTALIGAYERGGEWLRALEAFRLVRGARPGAGGAPRPKPPGRTLLGSPLN